MKYLINLCAHDGISSRYTGVGSMVERYITALQKLSLDSSDEFFLNLITPEYKSDSFGYSRVQQELSKKAVEKLGGKLYMVSNGSEGKVNYGEVDHWRELCKNTSKLIGEMVNDEFDLIINFYNDTPFANLASYLEPGEKTLNVWIPHSTVKIHGADSAIKGGENAAYFAMRLGWEEASIAYINKLPNCFVGAIGTYIKDHLLSEYGLHEQKCLDIHNGVIPGSKPSSIYQSECELFISQLDASKALLISFARAESYKNLEYTMQLGAELRDEFETVVIAQSYYPTQPILDYYRKMAKLTGVTLFVDPPFGLASAILDLSRPTVVLVPSKRETMGLIINEIRSRNDPNLLIVSSDIPGQIEQIEDGIDGVLISTDLTKLSLAADKIRKHFRVEDRNRLANNGAERVAKDYNLVYNFNKFMSELFSRANMALNTHHESSRSIRASFTKSRH